MINLTSVKSRMKSRSNARTNKLLKILYLHIIYRKRKIIMESLILAQSERWRRA
jgi:hypothetical protein